MGGKAGVVTAAVLHVQDQGDIQDLRLQRRIAAVRAQNVQNILRGGQFGLGLVYVQALSVMVVTVCLIAVDRQHREKGDQLQTLSEYVRQGRVVRPVVVGVEREHASGKRVHHVVAGRFHDDIAYKAGGKRTVTGQQTGKLCQFVPVRQLIEQKQISHFLKAEAVLACKTIDQILNVVAAVEETAVCRDLYTVHDLTGAHVGDIGQAGKDALTV